MAPFIVRDRSLLNNWRIVREDALARVRAQAGATQPAIAGLRVALDAANLNANVWTSQHPVQAPKLAVLRDDLRAILKLNYGWALSIDFSTPENMVRFRYVSEEKPEPGLWERASEDRATLEQPLCIACLASELDETLQDRGGEEPVAAVLLGRPEHGYMVRRV